MRRPRDVGAVIYAIGYGLIAVAYLWAPYPHRSGTTSVVTYIRDLGPIWAVAFGLAAVMFAATVHWWQHMWLAHSFAAAVVAGYGTALLAGGLLSTEVYGSPGALLAFTLTAQHVRLGRRNDPRPVERHEP